jgi:hypothetical protein
VVSIGATDTTIQLNSIGVNRSNGLNTAYPNLNDGIYVVANSGAGTTIGGNSGTGNVISGNTGYGVDVEQAGVVEDYNNIGIGSNGLQSVPNIQGGTKSGVYGPHDKHQ